LRQIDEVEVWRPDNVPRCEEQGQVTSALRQLSVRQLTRRGVLDVVAKYRLSNNITFGVPLSHLPWDYHDVVNYEIKLMDAFCDAIAPLRDVVLFDCGADIGTFSVLICSRTEQIGTVVAFEPNADVREFLRSNLSNLPVSSELVPSVVGGFTGAGRLERPAYARQRMLASCSLATAPLM
jgi:hypothetical protein